MERRWNFIMVVGTHHAVNTTNTNSHTHYEWTFYDPQSSLYKGVSGYYGGW